MLWRYKWTAEQSSKQLQVARQKLQDITNGAKYKMLLHTADYLNRLVQDFFAKGLINETLFTIFLLFF